MLHTSDKEHKGIYTQLHSSHKCMRADIMGAKHRAPSASDDAREAEQEVARVEEKKKGGGWPWLIGDSHYRHRLSVTRSQ